MTLSIQKQSYNDQLRRGLGAMLVMAGLVGGTAAHAAPVFADWAAGSADGIAITVVETVVSGEIVRLTRTVTAPAFIASYGSEHSVLEFGALNAPADLLAEISFSQALPKGSLLFAFDMDFNEETFVISSDLGFLTLLEQGETENGASSSLPTYDDTTGNLVSTVIGGGGNENEYTLFDGSGLSSLSVQFLNGGFDSGSWIALATPEKVTTSPVPLPASLPLLLAGVAGLGVVRRRR